MTEQERAAALAGRMKALKADAGGTMYFLSAPDIDLIDAALRTFARPAPADLREAAANAAYDATRLEDGTPQFADAGFTLGHAAKIADAVLSLLPQTQESDVLEALRAVTVELSYCADQLASFGRKSGEGSSVHRALTKARSILGRAKEG